MQNSESDMSEQTMNVHQRLAAAMQKVKYIQKERKQGMQYTVVLHDTVTALVRPALLEVGVIYYPHRLSHVQNGNRTEVTLTVRFANIDDPKDCIDVPSFGYGIDNQDKGPGKAVSYAVKYALLKALGLETGDDPDTEQIEHQPDSLDLAIDAIHDASSLDELKAVFASAYKAAQKARDDDRQAVLKIAYDNRKAELGG